jgi:hypothetical protein
MKIGIFTNGLYDIKGIIVFRRLIGRVIRSDFEYIYKVGQFVNLPEYHNQEDVEPQFVKKQNKNIQTYRDEYDWLNN